MGSPGSPSANLPQLAEAVRSARGSVPDADWFATGTSVLDRFSSGVVEATIGEGPAPARGSPLARAIAAAGFIVTTWRRMAVARGVARRLTSRDGARRPVYLIRTWAHVGAFGEEGFRDPYFGPLAGRLEQRGREVVTVVGALSDHAAVYSAASGADGVVPEHAFLRWADPLAVAWRTLRRRPRVTGPVEWRGEDIAARLRAAIDAEHGRRQVFANRLQLVIARRIAERFDVRAAALTHEGYAWERQFVLGLRDAVPGVWIVGYQHAPLSDGATSLVAVPGAIAGLPDRVVAMGKVTANMLVERGYPAETVAPGPSLRMRPPAPSASPARSSGHLLAVLGEVSRAVRLARVAGKLAHARPGARVALRLHPLAPRERFLAQAADVLAEPGVSLSEGRSLADDLSGASAVLYDASAVAFEAVADGIPVIHVALGDPLSLDPLAALGALHATAADAAGVATALDGFEALSDDVYRRQAEEARSFVEAYLGEVSDGTLAAFLPPGEDAP